MSYREKHPKNSSDSIKHRCFHPCLQRSRQRAPLSCCAGSNCTTTTGEEDFEPKNCMPTCCAGGFSHLLHSSRWISTQPVTEHTSLNYSDVSKSLGYSGTLKFQNGTVPTLNSLSYKAGCFSLVCLLHDKA